MDEKLRPEQLEIDASIHARAGIDQDILLEFIEAKRNGAVFPKLTVFRDGRGVNWLADGFIRYYAESDANSKHILCDIREGERDDAILYSTAANTRHGNRQTPADKRRAVALTIGVRPKWSDLKVSRHCDARPDMVSSVRASLNAKSVVPGPDDDDEDDDEIEVERGNQKYTMRTKRGRGRRKITTEDITMTVTMTPETYAIFKAVKETLTDWRSVLHAAALLLAVDRLGSDWANKIDYHPEDRHAVA